MVPVPRLPALLSLIALSLPMAAVAQPVSAASPATGQRVVVSPLTLVKVDDMDFAELGVTTGGTATIDPITGQMTVAGGLVHLGGTPSPARYAPSAARIRWPV